jgi:excinuclease ABC subunit A
LRLINRLPTPVRVVLVLGDTVRLGILNYSINPSWPRKIVKVMDSQPDAPIVVRGAKEHNLQNVNLELPRNKLIVFTGVSGSGKSSLAFDTIFAEGQRRYVESLSNYARQFLGQLPKPNVESISGLSPTISIQQKSASRNPRSTVGTVTEVSDFLRVLFARLGQGHCPKCKRPIVAQTREQIIGQILSLPEGTRYTILAPLARGQKGEFKDLFADLVKRGFVRARVDGTILRMTDDLKLDKKLKHNIELVIDRLQAKSEDTALRIRIAEAVEQALNQGQGNLIIAKELEPTSPRAAQAEQLRNTPTQDVILSAHFSCTHCQLSYDPPSPQMFSFNNPQGMCKGCDGLGSQFTFAEELLIPDPSLSLHDGALPLIGAIKSMGRWKKHIYEGVAKSLNLDPKQAWKSTSAEHKKLWLYGSGEEHIVWEWKSRGNKVWKHSGKWEGVVPQLISQFKKATAGPRRVQLEKYMRVVRCPLCHGERLNAQARSVKFGGMSLIELSRLPIGELSPWFDRLEKLLKPVDMLIAGELFKEIRARLGFLLNVGLHYLSLDRSAPTLSGGEAQRIRLAGQIGSGLVGVLYILDEPSIGLHPRDNDRLLQSLLRLRDIGNTVLVVEHDEDTMRAADYLVDFGPGPGIRGGQVVAAGPPDEVLANPASVTGRFLSGIETIPVPKVRRAGTGEVLRVVGARHNNLKNVTVDFPLGKFICITGVSGSGKSTLVNDILKEALLAQLGGSTAKESEEEEQSSHEIGVHDRIEGAQHIDKVIDIDQSPIGRTPRSNPATYIKLWDEIRSVYSSMTDAKLRGYSPGRFSFNVAGGRCEACQGNGSNRLEMDFLADVWVQCPVCDGKRFNRETLQVKYRGLNIHEVLELEVAQALEHFEHIPKAHAMLQTLHDVGLDYIKLGQPSSTLSGGEAQRIKLAKELCRKQTGKTLYVLDEPTTGLHFVDIKKLLEVLQGFVNQGNTVLVIEHNLDVMKSADWIIDMGPDGGAGGGEMLVCGTPEQIVQHKTSFTAQALRPVLQPVLAKKPGSKKLKEKAKKKQTELLTNLEVVGACQHNLKNVSASIPRNQMTVFCGPSGSGKTSLAMDTIYAEGQRRYVESLSSYARQFLGQVQKPRVDQITGLSPSIAIEQKTTSKSPRSTVGTITEIYDYLRVLYARLGQRFCPKCQVPIGSTSTDQIVKRVMELPEGTKIYILAPVERKANEKYETILDEIRRTGYVRIRIDGKSVNLDESPKLDHRRKHQIEVVVDRNIVRASTVSRIAEAVEQALQLGEGVIHIAHVDADRDESRWQVDRYSRHLACHKCGTGYEVLNPHHYSFNSSLGWCPTCEGLGFQRGANEQLLIGNSSLSVSDGAISGWPSLEENHAFLPFAEALAAHAGFRLDVPIDSLRPEQKQIILDGTGEITLPLKGTGHRFQYRGLFPAIDEASRLSFLYRMRLEHVVDEVNCTTCHGDRIRPDAAATRYLDIRLADMCHLSLQNVHRTFAQKSLNESEQQIAGEVVREIVNRLEFLLQVGLEYLSLDRKGPTLSGGESQRIRLASQVGSGLTGVLYVLDEPTIGLHPRDNARLIEALARLRRLGNTLLLVEHDREVITAADHVLDFGPGAGDQGGEITCEGSPAKILKSKSSLTGAFLSGREAIPIPTNRRVHWPATVPSEWDALSIGATSPIGSALSIIGARQHNLKNVTVHIPLATFVAVTGVSGSGKSSLINEVLYNTLARKLHRAQTPGAAHDEILGIEQLDKIINVDQAPLGNTPSSNPATYTGVFDLIRELFARLPESKVRGYHPRRFSFNQKGGRCETCEGNGQKLIEMHFLPDVWIECETCHGSRYNAETLRVLYKGHSIADVLKMRISEALSVFDNIPKIRVVLQTLCDVGLGYMAMGQSAPTMSGGEAQRVKLAAELARPSTGRTIYLLDEPTTGLHFDDVRKLLLVLHRLVDLGNTVIVVEHNLDVIKSADWIIDVGPEAGYAGGQIVTQGVPEHIVLSKESHTAKVLAGILKEGPYAERAIWTNTAIAREGDLELSEVGADAALPWEANGRKWHTEDRITTKGTACKWDGAALAEVVDKIEELGELSETNWSQRSVVEIAAKTKSQGWFLHALTGHEAYLSLTFRVARSTFKQPELHKELSLVPLNSIRGLESYSRDERIVVAQTRAGWQEVNITIVSLDEIQSEPFQKFLRAAHASFLSQIEKLNSKTAEPTPWKQLGKKWHLASKGFPIGKTAKWDLALVPRLLTVLEQVDDTLEWNWDVRDAITIRSKGITRMWARVRSKDPACLELMLFGPPGKFNRAVLEKLAAEVVIENERTGGIDVIRLRWQKSNQLNAEHLSPILKSHLGHFRAASSTDS